MRRDYYAIIFLALLVAIVSSLAFILIAGTGSSDDSTTATVIGAGEDLHQGPDDAGLNTSYRTITDMAGRTVTIPVNISMVLCTSPPPTTFVYMLAPDKLGGWQSALSDEGKKYIPKAYQDLPVLSWNPVNYEAYIAMSPDLVFISHESGVSDPGSADLTQEKFGTIPVVCVDNARNATSYGPTLLFMGDVLGVPDVAARQNAYYQSVLDEVQTKVAAIPEEERVRVYYAEGTNGLSTDASGSPHSQLIDVCRGLNVADGLVPDGSQSSTVTKESVLMWKPDLIITTSEEFAAQVYNDTTWQLVPAVQNHKVYLTPKVPYNWFDRPPGVNRIVGIPWTAHVLYPDLFPEDWFREQAKEFYAIFYHYELSDEELTALLSG